MGLQKNDIASEFKTDEPQVNRWQFIANAITTYRPVAMIWNSGKHSSVICGVKIENGLKQIKVADPIKDEVRWENFDFYRPYITTLHIVKDDKVDSIKARFEN